MTRIEEAITEWFGKRCPDNEPGCPCCDAWAEYDAMTPAPQDQQAEVRFAAIVAARKAHVDAVAAYNARREVVKGERERGNWFANADQEFSDMNKAQSEFIKTAQRIADAALVHPAAQEARNV